MRQTEISQGPNVVKAGPRSRQDAILVPISARATERGLGLNPISDFYPYLSFSSVPSNQSHREWLKRQDNPPQPSSYVISSH